MTTREKALGPSSGKPILLGLAEEKTIACEKILKRIKRNKNGCWIWMRHRKNGYGSFNWRGRTIRVHRLAYEAFKGEIQEGLELDHLCKERACVNPWHLEPVNSRTNVLRGEGQGAMSFKKKQCLNGHEFKGKNFYVFRKGSDVRRICRICQRDRKRSERLLKRAV